MNRNGPRIFKHLTHIANSIYQPGRRTFQTTTMAGDLPITQGVFAVNKPQGVTSAQVLRDLQFQHFDDSKLFAGLLANERQKRATEPPSKSRAKRDRKKMHVKMGHGGTLDPLATGVLIIAVGNGTKSLPNFIGCTKSYETVCLFGASTDTYDITGKVVERKPWDGVTKESVTQALGKFKGKIMQRPPVYSALWINGRRAYDIAREGGDLPEMKEREVEVTQMELLEWLEPGAHEFKIPEDALTKREKEAAVTLAEKALKRKRDDNLQKDAANEADPAIKKAKRDEQQIEEQSDSDTENNTEQNLNQKGPVKELDNLEEAPVMSGAIQPSSPTASPADPSLLETESSSNGPPAARIRMTVSSGFYVRSLCHDLGAALGSAGHMASLVRTRQGEFSLGENVMEMKEFESGEEEKWAGKLKGLLDGWVEKNKDIPVTEPVKQRGSETNEKKGRGSQQEQKKWQPDRPNWRDSTRRGGDGDRSRGRPYQDRDRASPTRRRNSSSDTYD